MRVTLGLYESWLMAKKANSTPKLRS